MNCGFIFLTGRLSLQLKNVEKQRTMASDKRMQTLSQLIEGIKAVRSPASVPWPLSVACLPSSLSLFLP